MDLIKVETGIMRLNSYQITDFISFLQQILIQCLIRVRHCCRHRE